MLLTALTDRFYRATRDIDVRAYLEKDETSVRAVIGGIATIRADDGMTFDAQSIKIRPIHAQGEHGFRAVVPATIGRARANVQIDLGFDDVVILPDEHFAYPVLLPAYPAPDIRAYSEETIVAEKLEAIAAFDDERNSRFKDYDDVVELAAHTTFDASTLWLGISTTFRARKTDVADLWPSIVHERAASRETAYAAYRERLSVRGEKQTFATCLERLRAFVEPLGAYDIDGRKRVWEHRQWTMR